MSKHTKGPWSENQYGELKSPTGKDIGVWHLGIAHVSRTPEAEANARLIKAAPDLLAALEAFMAHYDQHQKPMTEDERVDNDLAWFEAVDAARPVIARARGES